jgi:hypothetical protein
VLVVMTISCLPLRTSEHALPSFASCAVFWPPLTHSQELERRKRTGRALLLAGLCLPKALAPILPIYLAGVLQVGAWLR